MNAVLARYESYHLAQRLFLITAAAIILNAIYCLAYTRFAGHPSTLFQAVAWGTINLAPWIAAVEIGRHNSTAKPKVLLLVGAGFISLALEAVILARFPDSFDLVRRLPGIAGAALALVALAKLQSIRASRPAPCREISAIHNCQWIKSAGNYVEVHAADQKAQLVRSSLSACIAEARLNLVRVHRSYAVSREAIDVVERTSIRLNDGTRLPIGDRYRESISIN